MPVRGQRKFTVNRTVFRLTLIGCAWLGAAGCSNDKGGDVKAADAGASAAEWQTLITGDWKMPQGTEGYVCVRKTLTEDVYVSGFDAIIPRGTHHTLLTMGAPDAPDGVTDCNAGVNRTQSLFGSGLGTDTLLFPEGVGFRIPAGTQLLLNLHLFNTTTQDISGTSGTRVRIMAPEDLVHEAEGVLAGTVALNIPAGETTVHTGYCTMAGDVTIFAVAPHMHQLGIYEKIVAETGAQGDVVLHDAAYSFEEQSYELVEPLQLLQGERVRIECTHHNSTSADVYFGESTLQEMCFAGLYRYPALGGIFICADGQGGGNLTLDGPPCAASGATGNSLGIGKECTTGGGECGFATICVADYVKGTWGNFCTTTCSTDADCGAGAVCSQSQAGASIRTCIPTACVGTAEISDGGL
jgi:hypothetical protein